MKSFYMNVNFYYVNEKKNISDGLYEFISRHINVVYCVYKVIWWELWHEYDVQGNIFYRYYESNCQFISVYAATKNRTKVKLSGVGLERH